MPPTSIVLTQTPRRKSRPSLRILVLTGVMFSLMVLGDPSHSVAQVMAKKKDEKPVPLDTRPMARYVAKDHIILFLASDGIDAQPDAWKKTAAYKMLNDTPLGSMLEAMLTQIADRVIALRSIPKLTGADVTLILKHAVTKGFVLGGMGGDKAAGRKNDSVLVFRGAYSSKEARPAFARLMGAWMGTNKFASIKKGTRTVVRVTPESPAEAWNWWPEQGDIVVSDNVDATLDMIDGKTANAVDHPIYSSLAKDDSGFTPLGVMFLDFTPLPPQAGTDPKAIASYVKFKALVDRNRLTRFDYRWGFQDDALMSVTRIHVPKPRAGLFALVDQPPFDRTKLIPIPAALESYTAWTLDVNQLGETVSPAMSQLPPQSAVLTDAFAALESKSRIDFKKDILGKLGPKMVFYVMPGGAEPRAATDAAPKAEINPLAASLGMPLPSFGGMAAPRYTLVAEIKDPVALESDLDNVMVAFNKEIKAKAAEAAKAEEDAAKSANPGGRNNPGRTPEGRRAAPPASPEFKLMPGAEKVYMWTMPPDQAKQWPAGFRPTIRLGKKHVAIAANPEAARLALEAQGETYTPPADLAVSLDRLPKDVLYLNVNDPKGTEPELLATLPGMLQGLINAILSATEPSAAPATAGAAGAAPTPGGAAGGPVAGTLGNDEKRGRGGRGGPPGMVPPGGQGGPPGGAGGPMAGFRGMAGGPGAAKKPEDKKSSPFFFEIDPSLLPSADDLRSKLFPTVFAISADDNMIVFQTRGAFPYPISKETIQGLTFAIPMGKAMSQGGVPPAGMPGMAGPGAFPGMQPPGPGAAGKSQGRPGGGGRRAEQ